MYWEGGEINVIDIFQISLHHRTLTLQSVIFHSIDSCAYTCLPRASQLLTIRACLVYWTHFRSNSRLIYLFVYSFIHSFIYSFIISFIHFFFLSFIHSLIHSFIHLFIYFKQFSYTIFAIQLHWYYIVIHLQELHYN